MKAERLAQALHALTAETKGVELTARCKSFFAFLRARGYSKLLPQILSAYTKISKQTQVSGTTVRVAKSGKVADVTAQHALTGTIKEVIDETLIGGYQIETESTLIDASHKSALLTIYQRITR